MKIQENIKISEFTTFRTGGKARYFLAVKSENELSLALALARKEKLNVFILGGGSNVAVSDDGYPGLVIKMEMTGIEKKSGEDVVVEATAGENWDRLVAMTVEWGLWGLENLSSIPGTVGAAPVQNIGAYGAEAKDFIVSVRAMDKRDSSIKTFTNEECRFSYRDSFFKTGEGKNYAITSVTFKLSQKSGPNLSYKDLKEYFSGAPSPSLSEIRQAVINIRKRKFPELSSAGTAGSFWKNPVISKEDFARLASKYPGMPSFSAGEEVKVSLAWILDKVCGLKGYKKGKVGLWKDQPLVIVAEKDAGFSEIESLASDVAVMVKEKTGIEIEREVQYV